MPDRRKNYGGGSVLAAPKITAIAPWFDAMAYALSLLKDGTLSIDSEGRIWRHFVRDRWGTRKAIARRAENGTRKGYLAVTLGIPKQRRTCKVQAHCLVWTWLHGPIPKPLQVNHKDLNKTNNRPDNLELTTGAGNIQHSYANGRTLPWTSAKEWRPGVPKRTPEQIAELFELHRQGKTTREICDIARISKTHLRRLLARKEVCDA